MTAYNFSAKFEEPIVAGRKITALRRVRPVGHAKVGGVVSLWIGSLYHGARHLGDAPCIVRAPVLLDASGVRTALPIDARDTIAATEIRLAWRERELEAIAAHEGFPRWWALADYLGETFGPEPWSLDLIGWEPLARVRRAAA